MAGSVVKVCVCDKSWLCIIGRCQLGHSFVSPSLPGEEGAAATEATDPLDATKLFCASSMIDRLY